MGSTLGRQSQPGRHCPAGARNAVQHRALCWEGRRRRIPVGEPGFCRRKAAGYFYHAEFRQTSSARTPCARQDHGKEDSSFRTSALAAVNSTTLSSMKWAGKCQMNSAPIVAAYGHLFPNLHIERDVLDRAGLQLVDANRCSDDELVALGACGILLGAFQKLDRARLTRLSTCKGVVRVGIGVDNIDLQAAKEAQITICNVPSYCIEEVAVHVLTCSLALMRGLSYWDRSVRSGSWRGKRLPLLRRPSTCTLGIIGFG